MAERAPAPTVMVVSFAPGSMPACDMAYCNPTGPYSRMASEMVAPKGACVGLHAEPG
jgi:hypothetical protein